MKKGCGSTRPLTHTEGAYLHHRHSALTPLDWYLVGEKCVVILCAGIAFAYVCGWLR